MNNVTVNNEAKKNKIPLIFSLANKFIKDLKIVESIDNLVSWDKDRWSVSPGNLIKAVILSTFQDIRPSFNKIDKNFEGCDCEYLFGEKVTSKNINQYNIGEALERFNDIDMEDFYEKVATDCIKHNNIPNKSQHADTTTVSFFGDYNITDLDIMDSELNDTLKIEHGYNKDHRPDCKQILIGHMVNESGIITKAKTMNGSTSDVEWSKDAVEQMKEFIENGLNEGILIADSKLVTKDLLKAMRDTENKVSFISRCPSNFAGKLESQVIEKAYNEESFLEIGQIGEGEKSSFYKGVSYEAKVEEIPVRLLVLHSTMLEKKAYKNLNKQKIKVDPLIKEIEKKEFSCEKDAKLECDRFIKNRKTNLFEFKFNIRCKKIEKWPKGPRSEKRLPEIREIFKIEVKSYEYNEIKKEKFIQIESCFVIISDKNLLELSDFDLLKMYKEQHVVEGSFRMLKQPCLASAYYLKKPERINALSIIFTISMLIRAVIQFKVREGLDEYNKENPKTVLKLGWNNKTLKKPTFYLIYEHFRNLYYEKQENNEYTISFFNSNSESSINTILSLMGFNLNQLLN